MLKFLFNAPPINADGYPDLIKVVFLRVYIICYSTLYEIIVLLYKFWLANTNVSLSWYSHWCRTDASRACGTECHIKCDGHSTITVCIPCHYQHSITILRRYVSHLPRACSFNKIYGNLQYKTLFLHACIIKNYLLI